MKSEWEIKKLGEVCNARTGNSINEKVKKEKYMGVTSGLPYIATKDISFSGNITYNNGVEIPVNDPNFKVSPANSTLICIEGGSAGRKVAFSEKDVCFVNKLISLHSKIVDNKYVYYYCLSDSFLDQFNYLKSGIIGGVSLNKFRDIGIPIAPQREQKRIVSKLDDIFKDAEKAKEIAEKNLQNAKDLFESYLENVFSNPGEGWNIEKLGNVCELVNRGISPKYINENGLHVINQRCIRNHYIDYSLARMHNEKVKKVSVDKYLRVGDVLINSTGVGTLGRVAQVKDLPFPATVDSHVTIVRPFSDKFNHQFFEFVLIYLEKSFEKSGMGASGQIELSRDTIKNNFTVSYPQSISTQTEIADKLRFLEDRVRTMVTIYKEKVSVVDELRKSVLNKAFSGEL